MDPEIVAEISEQIYKKFPEVVDVKPKIRRQALPADLPHPPEPRYLVTYHIEVRGPGGKNIPHWVRVAVTEQGKIIKTTTSR